jgi:hypothetical protein
MTTRCVAASCAAAGHPFHHRPRRAANIAKLPELSRRRRPLSGNARSREDGSILEHQRLLLNPWTSGYGAQILDREPARPPVGDELLQNDR